MLEIFSAMIETNFALGVRNLILFSNSSVELSSQNFFKFLKFHMLQSSHVFMVWMDYKVDRLSVIEWIIFCIFSLILERHTGINIVLDKN